MKYLCLVYNDRQKLAALTKEETAALQKASLPRVEELKKSGALVVAGGLGPEHVSIRPGAEAPLITDGPFAEAKEQVGGLFIIEAPDRNEALRVASGMVNVAPLGLAAGGGIEVRPIPYWSGQS